MALKVIGAGLGRTGTLSLKLALEHIGFGPCYHAMEIPAGGYEHVPLWSAAIRGEPDWDAIFDGYASTTDYPGCCFWRELADHYPDAKVVLSARDADGWFDSVSSTLFSPSFRKNALAGQMGELNRRFTLGIDEHLGDRAFMTDYFERWNQSVIDALPPERVLKFSAKDGWEPLCRFLGVPLPEAPYPRVNSRDELNQEVVGRRPATAAESAAHLRAHLDRLKEREFGPAA